MKKKEGKEKVIKGREMWAAIVNGLRILFAPVNSSEVDNHAGDGWNGRGSRQKPCLSAIGATLFWWLMSVFLGLLISRLH
ncbi:MAG: hypothetical protein DSY57_04925 [Desulfobulbus sp.]|nr:MAG: hypothetical protein DSY57_04925 [Desulfobulbus sp.]